MHTQTRLQYSEMPVASLFVPLGGWHCPLTKQTTLRKDLLQVVLGAISAHWSELHLHSKLQALLQSLQLTPCPLKTVLIRQQGVLHSSARFEASILVLQEVRTGAGMVVESLQDPRQTGRLAEFPLLARLLLPKHTQCKNLQFDINTSNQQTECF